MTNLVQFVQVLILFDAKTSRELGPALWAALLEIERFYNADGIRAGFQRYYISPHVPRLGLVESAWRGMGRLFYRGEDMEDALALLSQEQRVEGPLPASDVPGRWRTYDQHKLGAKVRNLIRESSEGSQLLIVTDREITPPADWRYIIWDEISGGAVISVVPTDPRYWRDRDPNRVATIKHRARTAGLAITGSVLGFKRCKNPNCFLYGDVDSATTLDLMLHLGEEHDIPSLAGRGFEPVADDPNRVQRIIENPGRQEVHAT